jgi:hypothetical protein
MLTPMRRSIQILFVLLLLVFGSVVSAQTPATCGVVGVDGPAQVDVGMPIRFKARISGMSHITRPEFKWSMSAGTIMMGQGTGEIMVDTTGLGGVVLTATVELAGVPLGCQGSGSSTTEVRPPALSCCRVFDQYGDIKFEDEKARLDNFAIQLSNEPLTTGYILMSAGQVTFEKEAAERLARAKSWVVDVREVDSNRVVTIDCGFSRDLTIQLYIAALGVSPPTCSNIEVPFSEVKFTKPRPKPSKKNP